MNTKNKVVSLAELPAIVEELKRQGKKIVTTNGAFDMLHIGQKRALEKSQRDHNWREIQICRKSSG